MRVLVVFVMIALAQPVFAQPTGPAACFPECRAGFTCRDGSCVADSAPAPQPTEPPLTGLAWGPESNAPGTGTQALAIDASPAPPPPKKPPRFEVGLTFGLDALFFSSKKFEEGSVEVDALANGDHYDHLNVSAPVEIKIREGSANMFFAARVGWGLVHVVEKRDSFEHFDSHAGVLVAVQQVFRIPLSRDDAPLLDSPFSVDLAVGGFFASQGTLGGMANATLNVYWLGVGPQIAYGTETELDLGLRFTSRVAF